MQINTIMNDLKFSSVKEQYRNPPVEKIHNESIVYKHKRFNPVSTSGWLGVGALVVSAISGFKHSPKLHKISALVAGVSILTHVGLLNSKRIFPPKNKKKDLIG